MFPFSCLSLFFRKQHKPINFHHKNFNIAASKYTKKVSRTLKSSLGDDIFCSSHICFSCCLLAVCFAVDVSRWTKSYKLYVMVTVMCVCFNSLGFCSPSGINGFNQAGKNTKIHVGKTHILQSKKLKQKHKNPGDI